MSGAEKKVVLTFQDEDEIRQRVEALAKRNDRSISAELRRAVRLHLEREEREADGD